MKDIKIFLKKEVTKCEKRRKVSNFSEEEKEQKHQYYHERNKNTSRV